MDAPQVSVIVRTRDGVAMLAATVESIRAQTVAAEIVVVDSGSVDGSLEFARRTADQVVVLGPGRFSFGGALNRGAERARGRFHAALSAHTVLPREDWLERAVGHLCRPRIAAACGCWGDPRDDGPLESGLDQGLAEWSPRWGFSNTASAWRGEVWREHRFDERMRAAEDLEWAWRVLSAGWRIAIDPALTVSGEHRRAAGLRALLDREMREQRELCSYTPARPLSGRAALAGWWGEMPPTSPFPPALRRANPYRMAEYGGRWLGGRRALIRRRQTPRPVRHAAS